MLDGKLGLKCAYECKWHVRGSMLPHWLLDKSILPPKKWGEDDSPILLKMQGFTIVVLVSKFSLDSPGRSEVPREDDAMGGRVLVARGEAEDIRREIWNATPLDANEAVGTSS